MTGAALPILATTGMMAEAAIARGHGVVAVSGGGDAARLALLLHGALSRGARGVISFGIAGGLAPGLRPGTTVLAEGVWTADGQRLPTDRDWTARLYGRLGHACTGDLAGVDHIVAGAGAKTTLRDATGALAVDMESHIAARLAAQHGVPFAALRIVADPADRTLPEAATVGMRPDGSMDAAAVLRSLLRRPGDIAALIRTAMDASAAFGALRRDRALLSATLGFADTVVVGSEARGTIGRPPMDEARFGTGGDVQVENG